MVEEKRSINKKKIPITIAVLTITVGLFLISRTYLISKMEVAYENVALQIYDENVLNKLDSIEDGGVDDTPPNSNPEDSTEEENNGDTVVKPTDPKNNYIGTIEISKINLKKGFVDPSSKYNDIGYNVTILKGFDYPDVTNGNFILASHSGTGPQSYFKNLYKLGIGDKATVTYKGKKYVYKITKIYTQKKQGYLTIYRDVNKTILTLITCTKNNNTLQTVYIAELI